MTHPAASIVILSLLLCCACTPAKQTPVLNMREGSVQVGDMNQRFRRAGQGQPLLLIHGLANTWRVWRPYLDALGGSYEVIVPDLRGHGDTTNPSPYLSVNQVTADMFALMDALGIERVRIVGYSFGGHVALRMAAMHPERVSAMVVIAGAHRLLGSARVWHEREQGANIPPGWWLTEVGRWHPGGENQVQSVYRQGIVSALGAEFEMSDESLAEIRARTLIIQGDRDEVYPLEVPLDMHRKVAGSQLWIIPNANHDTVFWQDVAPTSTDFGGSPAANKIFPELVRALFEGAER